MTETNSLSAEIAARHHELWQQALRECEFPAELPPQVVIKAIDHPEQFPAVIQFLSRLGTTLSLSYRSEFAGTYFSPDQEERKGFQKRYYQNLTATDVPTSELKQLPHEFSSRLFALCQTHSDGNPTKTFVLYYLMSEVIGPKLNYQYDLKEVDSRNGQPYEPSIIQNFLGKPSYIKPNFDQMGDFNLLLKYLTTHYETFKRAFFASKEPFDTKASLLAKADRKTVGINWDTLNRAFNQLEEVIGTIDLDAYRIDKKKIANPHADPFPRATATSITNQFEKLFVDLNLFDPAATKQALGLTIDLQPADLAMLREKFALIEALLLSVLTDKNSHSLTEVLSTVHPNLDAILPQFLEYATTTDHHQRQNLTKTIELGTAINLEQAIRLLTGKLMASKTRGGGASAVLMTNWNQLRTNSSQLDGHRAEQLEKLMWLATQLITNPKLAEQLNLEEITSPANN